MTRLAIVTTHPIQYQVPWFRALAAVPGIDLTVLFAWLPDAEQQGEGFGVSFQWDIPLLEGYQYDVLPNVARTPGVDQFSGCDIPSIGQVLQQGRYDAVIVNGWVVKTCLQALWACRRIGTPCLVRGESNALRPRARWKRLLHRLLLSQYAACLCIGQANRAFYQANGVPKPKALLRALRRRQPALRRRRPRAGTATPGPAPGLGDRARGDGGDVSAPSSSPRSAPWICCGPLRCCSTHQSRPSIC